jgi:serine/threonine-protein kinase HipA
MAHEIAVWLFDQPVGTLSLVAGRLNFQYGADWLNKPTAMALSRSLPLQAESFDDHQCRAFFAGLLPEGNLRRLIAQQYQVSSQNDFALLNAVGGECAGAITFVPAGQPLASAEQPGVEWLDEQQLMTLLDELPRRPMLAGRDGIRLSLAGAQDKLPVVFDGQRIGLPMGGQPSTHILKPAIAAVEDSVRNEAYCMSLAQAMGLSTAQAQIFPVGDRRVLLATRYDRVVRKDSGADGQIVRVHQEDFCQALGVVPEMKYQNEGGPDLKACFDLLRKATRPSAPQVLRLFDAVVFNALIGNHDAHAKNFSLLYTSATPILAPLYDLLSTAVYENLTPKMAMKLGSKYKFTEVQARHWEQFAEAAGLSKAQTKKRALGIAQELPATAKKLQASPQFADQPIITRIVALIEQRTALTVRRLTETGQAIDEEDIDER